MIRMHRYAPSYVTVLPHTPSPCFNVDFGVPSFALFSKANCVMFPVPLSEVNLINKMVQVPVER